MNTQTLYISYIQARRHTRIIKITKQLGGDLPKEYYGGQPTQSKPTPPSKKPKRVGVYNKAYYEKHKHKIKAYNKKYADENREQMRDFSRKHYEEHKDFRWTCKCCNRNIKLVSKHMHLKTKMHLRNRRNADDDK